MFIEIKLKIKMTTETLSPTQSFNTDSRSELELSHEQLSKLALENALSIFAISQRRQEKYKYTSGDQGTREEVSDTEAIQSVFEDMQQQYDKLVTLGDVADRPAALTVAIPVAIRSEEPEQLARLISLIHQAQQQYDKPVDVILWNNAKSSEADDPDEITKDALSKHESMIRAIEDFSDTNVRLRTAFEVNDPQEGAITSVRHRQMSAVAMNTYRDSADFMHPVIWLDADTIDLSKNAFVEMDSQVRSGSVLFPHLETNYGIDWVDKDNPKNIDTTTRIVVVNEIIRRIVMRGTPTFGRDDYYEESGMGFAIGTYLTVGGTDTSESDGESIAMIKTAEMVSRVRRIGNNNNLWSKKGKVFGPSDRLNESPDTFNVPWHDYGTDQLSDSGGHIIPNYLLPDTVETEFMQYIQTAHSSMSARRQRERVNQGNIRNLHTESRASDYRLYSDMKDPERPNSGDNATREDMLELLDNYEERTKGGYWALKPKERRIAESVIERYFNKR